MGYQKTAIKSISWVGSLRLFMRIFGMARFAILARILDPTKFGTFAIASLMVSLLEIFTETGINIVLVQEDSDDIDHYIDTAWIISILRGFIIGLPIIMFSPQISRFFNVPEAALLIQITALTPIIKGFINPSVAKFQKHLTFSKEFTLRTIQTTIDAAVAISVALITRSEYALAYGMISSGIAEVILSFILASPKPTFNFNRSIAGKIVHSGKWITLAGIFQYFYIQGPDMVIGKLLNATALGIWQAAVKFAFVPINEVLDVFNRVAFPVYVKINGDKIRTRRAFIKNMIALNSITIPIAIIIFFFSKPIISFTLGSDWLEAASIMAPLAIYIVVSGIAAPASPLLLAYKKQRLLSHIHVVSTITLFSLMFTLIPHFGLQGIITSLIVNSTIFMPIYLMFGIKQLI